MTNPLSQDLAQNLEQDLDEILSNTDSLWDELRNKQIFITGGTGFFGSWILESFIWVNQKLGLNAKATVLTRDPEAFCKKNPHFANQEAITYYKGDVRDFEFPKGEFSHIIHAATDSGTNLNQDNPLLMIDTIIEGTRHTLDFALQSGATKFLLTSSGAVYGKQPPELRFVHEEYQGAPSTTDLNSGYAEGKRVAELLCAMYHKTKGLETKIARCFAFVGPYLPINAHFAIGNFIRDGMNGEPIHIKGDGTPYRSYLYATDLVIWLWTILFRGKACQPYNVGSEDELTIADLARVVKEVLAPDLQIIIAKEAVAGRPAERYVPSVQRVITDLNLSQRIDLREAIRRTANWHKRSK